MYMSLSDLRAKFVNDQAFAVQFVADALQVGIDAAKVDILDQPNGEGGKVDLVKLENNKDLLHTYVEAVTKMTNDPNAQGRARLYAYLHAPWDGNVEDGAPGEPEFTIDTNTRTITVPPVFVKNGVGVTGDHLAEILFFRMPRFYDVVDLYNSTKIRIYWYNNGNKASAVFHQTQPAIIYAEDEDLVLGWAISELATETAGTIEFFFEFEHTREVNGEGVVDFRLETQPAKVTIKSTLELDKAAAEVEQYNDMIYSRSIYSPIINTLTASPARITVDLPEGDEGLADGHKDFPDGNSITFNIDAVSPDGGTVLYDWTWNGVMVDQPDGMLVNPDSNPTYTLANPPKMIVFTDPAETTGETVPVTRYTAADMTDVENPSEAGLYELNGTVYTLTEDTEVDADKTYYTATTTQEDVQPVQGTTYKTLTTNVPGIYQVYVGNKTSNGGIRYVYSRIVIIDPANKISMTKPLLNEAYPDGIGEGFVAETTEANGRLSYEWHHVAPNGEDTIIANATSATYHPALSEAEMHDPAVRGWYYVIVTNTKNNTIEQATSNRAWIEMIPTKIAENAISLAPVGSGNSTWKIMINEDRFEGCEYHMYATVDVQELKGNQQTTVVYPVPNAEKYFEGYETTISLDDVPQLTAGKKFALNVYVVPTVTLPNTSERRYPAVSPKVPDYTWAATEVLEKS